MKIHPALAVRSSYSIGESLLDVKKIVARAKELGLSAVALTDTMTINAMIDFTRVATEAGIKPIIGCRLRIVDDPLWRKTKGVKEKAPPEFYVKLYARTADGIQRLFRLLTLAHSDERFYNEAKLGWSDLLAELDADALVVTLGDVYSALHHVRADEIAREIYTRQRRSMTFLELCPIATPLFETLNARAAMLSEATGIPCVVTMPAFYEQGDDSTADLLRAICDGSRYNEMFAWKPHQRNMTMMGPTALVDAIGAMNKRLAQRYPAMGKIDWRAALANTDAIVDAVDYVWSKAPIALPKMAEDEMARVHELCVAGWRDRFGRSMFGHTPERADLAAIYVPRLKYELDVLKKLSFGGYFLLVREIVQWSKSNGIAVGPGRGSAAGSLVAYLMGITDVDPIRFGLLFERFINPERIDLPDADLDFMSKRRGDVIDYITKRWGTAYVAGISNYTELGSASAIRDAARVSGLDPLEYACTKLMPKAHGISVSLKEAAEMVADIGKFRDKHPALWSHALKLEGASRSLGRHAAGVVVGGVPLVERAVVERRSGLPTVNWDKRIVEDQGLIKLDVLGLSTLDVQVLAVDFIWKRRGIRVDLLSLPLDDKKVLEAFAAGRTVGVFQFESGGMRKLLRDLGRDTGLTFDDIAAATALYRPGPMDAGLLDQYVAVKQGMMDISYDHELMEPALKDTFGVMVYQEQVMRVSRDIAGYSFPEADRLRKIMGKKEPAEMAKQRDKFVAGCMAGWVDVELEDGSKRRVHSNARFAVRENKEKHTIKEILANDYTILEPL